MVFQVDTLTPEMFSLFWMEVSTAQFTLEPLLDFQCHLANQASPSVVLDHVII